MNKIPLLERKKIPMRKCVATNKIFPQRELIRIVANKTGIVFIDSSKKANGRGAYLQPKLELIPIIKKNHSLERALKVKIDNNFYDEIMKEIKENWD